MNYVIWGWAVMAVSLAAVAIVTVLQGRRLSRRVPPERRRWM